MLSFPRLAATFAAFATLSSTVNAIGAVTRDGRYLYNSDGSRFYIKGIAYQEQGVVDADPNNAFLEPSTFIDPLANGTACQRDVPFLKQLTVNTIRVYSVNSSLNHDECMQAFSSAGIYTIIDLSLPVNGSIDRDSPSWSTNLLDLYIETINAFSKYDNVLAYNVGNEVVIAPNGTDALPFVKAAARDIRAYLNSQKSSALVGYAAIDGDDTWIPALGNYMTCDPTGKNSDSSSIDLFGLNNYEWCGNSTFQASYADKTGDFAGYNVVAYFSEYGCNQPSPRIWTEVPALFGSLATPVWSGGIAFSYFPAASAAGQFGMVTLSPDGSSVTTSTDFTNLQNMYSQVSFIDTPAQSSAPTSSFPNCAAENSTLLASSTLPPTPNDSACNCLERSLSCQFNPQTDNTTAILGPLLNSACSLLGQGGGNCNAISANGTSGQYGLVAECSPSVKLSFAFSQYFELNNRNPQACSFAGNGTVNSASSSSSSASSVASSCLASASGTSVPTAPAGAPSSSSGSSGNSSSSSPSHSSGAGSAVPIGDSRTLLGVALMFVVSVAGGVWSLA